MGQFNFNVPDSDLGAFRARAKQRQESMREVLLRAISAYLDETPCSPPASRSPSEREVVTDPVRTAARQARDTSVVRKTVAAEPGELTFSKKRSAR